MGRLKSGRAAGIGTVCALLLAGAGVFAETVSWPLKGDGRAEPASYELKSFGSPPAGTRALLDSTYRPELDMRETPWTLNGSFRSAGAQKGAQYLVGTRSGRSNYTGWDLILLDGKIRLMMTSADGSQKKQIMSSRRFDDGAPHRVTLSWQPGAVRLQVDDQLVGSTDAVSDLGGDDRRRFAIGFLWEKDKLVIPFIGELNDFKMEFAAPAASGVVDAAQLDRELKKPKPAASGLAGWRDVAVEFPTIIQGRGWSDSETPYQRLPESIRNKVRPEVRQLAGHSAGIFLHFKTSNAESLSLRWRLTGNNYLPHMSPLGVNGLDVYARINGKWRWAASARPDRSAKDNAVDPILRFPKDRTIEFMVYLPLYTGVEKMEIAVSEGGNIEPVEFNAPPIVIYGTSIVHGCSASRPGMTYPALLGRRLDLPVVNLGFSGHGTMDFEFAEIMAGVPASAYVIDCLPNMTSMPASEVKSRLDVLVRDLKKRRPETPILVVEDRRYAYPSFSGKERIPPHWETVRDAVAELTASGITGVELVRGDDLVGDDFDATIDGSHPTDLGMFRYAEVIEPVLRRLLHR
jgi:hypothetical protein